jgi:hypothetical protein
MPPTDSTPQNENEPVKQPGPAVTPEPQAAPPEPAAPAGPVQPLNITPLPSEPAKNKSRLFKPSKKLLIPIAAVLLLAGGSAAAFYGYVIPNKPNNVLAKSIDNSLGQHQFTAQGTLDYTSGGVSGKLEYTAAVNEDSHAADIKLNTTISGVTVPLEALSAKGNYYFKVGDLSSVEGIVNGFLGGGSPDIKTLEDKINKSIANQWISVDSTLVKEAKLSCLSDFPGSFSQSDIDSIKTAYKNSPFVTISSHSADTVNGQKATKFILKIDDNNLSRVNLGGSSYFKKFIDCIKQSSPSAKLDLSSFKDNDSTPVTLWVDSASKRIVKYSSQSTAQDKQKGVAGDITGTITYGAVNISPPAGAKPVIDLLDSLDLGNLITSNDVNNFSDLGTSPAAKDTERKTDILALQGQLEAYNATNGYYPTLASLNDPAWRTKNMPGLDIEALKDPAGTSSILSSQSAKNVYAYQVTPATCDNGTHGNCNSYVLTATLDAGGTYVKQSLN